MIIEEPLYGMLENIFGDPLKATVKNLIELGNEYFKELKDFEIKIVYRGERSLPKIFLINGFLQKHEKIDDWLESINQKFPNHTKLHVDWDSRNLNDFSLELPNIIQFGNSIPTFIINMWYRAYINAGKAGVILASEILKRKHNYEYIFMGHSLGSRVAYYAAEKLAEQKFNRLHSMYLLSGAVGNKDWEKIAKIVKHRIYNFYSKEDNVLSYLYRASSAWLTEEPIGITRIDIHSKKVKNYEVTKYLEPYIGSCSLLHMCFKKALKDILKKIEQNNK